MTPQTPASPAPRAGRGGAGLLPDARTMTDPQVTEFLVVHPGETIALAWVVIEENLAGGFNLWVSASGDESRYGRFCLKPYWRPDGQAARDAAWDLILDLAEEVVDDRELPAQEFAIQICDHADVLAEVPVPMGVPA